MLDHDHRELIKLVNELHTATTQGEGRHVVGKILSELIRYTHEHFQREEHHMEKNGYARLEDHRRLHQELLQAVRGLQEKFNSGNVTVAAQVSMLLRDWLSLHIVRKDKEYIAQKPSAATPGGIDKAAE